MKIALLGTGFGQAHAAVYAQRRDVDEVVVFGRTPEKLAAISGQFGFATTTDLDTVITDPSVDLVDICLPTRLHADVAVRAMRAGQDVLIELPLATTVEDARRVVAAQRATGRQAFVDMFSRFSPASQYLRQAVAGQRYGPLTVLEIEGRTALLWEGYDLGLDTLALDMITPTSTWSPACWASPPRSRSPAPAPAPPVAAARPPRSSSVTRTPSHGALARR
jgi:UDP-N-acetylglucosamine 3-dehydrogenase